MSRSQRKNPYFTDQQNQCTKLAKRQANRVVRDLPLEATPKSGKSYTKESCSWSIRDWSSYAPSFRKARNK